MKHNLLITRPNFDVTTRYLFVWAKKIIELAEKKCGKIFDLKKQRANRKEFESVMRKHEPGLVFLNGHGDERTVAGQDNEVLIRAGENEEILKAKIVYALSCRSGKILGPYSVKAGADAYIGYDEDFYFLYDNDKQSRPEQDKTAEMFLEPASQAMVSLLKNHSPQEAHINSKKSFACQARKLLTSSATSLESSAVKYLIWNMQHQVCVEK